MAIPPPYVSTIWRLRPPTVEIGWRVWSTPTNFNWFRVLGSLLHRCHSTEDNQTLHDVWPSPALVYYIYIFGGSCPPTEFFQPAAKFTLHPSLAFYYIGSIRYCTALQHWCQPKFAAWYKECNYGTFAEGATYIRQGGHQVEHRPTF